MNKQEEINDLKHRIKSLEAQIKNCKHIWKDSKYDPETIKVQDDRAGYEHHGSDHWPKLSFHDESKPRWSRECRECGVVQYTYTQETVEVKKEPKFNN